MKRERRQSMKKDGDAQWEIQCNIGVLLETNWQYYYQTEKNHLKIEKKNLLSEVLTNPAFF